jgi:hypothetical protein
MNGESADPKETKNFWRSICWGRVLLHRDILWGIFLCAVIASANIQIAKWLLK